jgi:hypothetical protein
MNADEDQQAVSNLPDDLIIDQDLSAADSLDNRSHGCSS